VGVLRTDFPALQESKQTGIHEKREQTNGKCLLNAQPNCLGKKEPKHHPKINKNRGGTANRNWTLGARSKIRRKTIEPMWGTRDLISFSAHEGFPVDRWGFFICGKATISRRGEGVAATRTAGEVKKRRAGSIGKRELPLTMKRT